MIFFKMWWQFVIIVSVVYTTAAIKVPVDRKDENTTDTIIVDNDSEKVQIKPSPIIYYTSDDKEVDSYLIPPDQNTPQEKLPDNFESPATHLVPPTPDKQSNYYFAPTEAGQSDWQPIANNQPVLLSPELQPPRFQQENIPIFLSNQNLSQIINSVRNTRVGKVYSDEFPAPIPSVRLEPPPLQAPNEYLLSVPSKYVELTPEEQNRPVFQGPLHTYRKKIVAEDSILSLTPLRLGPPTLKIPTNLYPKKFNAGFKPVPIPISQYAEGVQEIPRAKPMKIIKPIINSDMDYLLPINEKKLYQYQEAQQKRKVKNVADSYQPFLTDEGRNENYNGKITSEQETSETNHRYPGRNIYPAPLGKAPSASPQRGNKDTQAPDDRTEFRMHGMKGPHSYQFGYDTGKGKNRQFRYEERDNDGQIRGHYGYMDKYGKLRIVNYSAHPELGFHAEAPVEQE